MHDEDFDHEHEVGLTDADRRAIAQAILEQDTLELRTVGIDIGSSTSHLLFARVFLRRETHHLSSRFVVVGRTVEWRSPILLTPFLPDGTIDAHELAHFVKHCYADAGFSRADVDSGAVILTGEAVKRKNARAIDEIFAAESGKFVCATAGHKLEAILAAHGSGATALSAERGACALHVDIGGGTTKLALIDRGVIRGVAAFAVGGRLLAQDGEGRWTRADEPARLVAAELGLDTTPEALADPAVRQAISRRLARLLADRIVGAPPDELGRALQLTEPLARPAEPAYLTFSGGVAEYLFGHETQDYGDIARELAAAVIDQLGSRVRIPAVDGGQRIRATVIGASQFTVQVSGKTIHLGGHDALPVQNVPVVHLGQSLPAQIHPAEIAEAFRRSARRQDRDPAEPLALAFSWSGPPTYDRLTALCQGIIGFAGSSAELLLLVVDGDVGQTLGRILDQDLGLNRKLISLDGIELKDLDFVDVGALLDPPGVVPVVIKSLLFS
ncbi:ethanolamine ammonia-lyase reactivating factor EutA [Amycolatopsis acidiphila]|uniref:Reactivating factor for ethanolamine ammonia lyase n=1 Tax=Amycolatopsis acidiphila TaxID=715473 RepID=A0A558AFA5_9PSEU|nr:ethanolamine ammonia-lyase reactivating factor EutA [Amycolatopsis acidiphila]TVT22942.1 reactivating factor for ethanolamine ammonia lyase [Amycolatopsis acidiphila]UIJ57103.1 ethanolamine ammonia-lyase reactivating factor EutA [Amycolatopsis acidiphila]GHG53342.1 ethanolamine utilization protein [Amycolatopsis acidiphila]